MPRSNLEIVHITNDADAEAFYQQCHDKRLDDVKKPSDIVRVGDTVRLNDYGLEQVFGTTLGLSHMRVLTMKVTKVSGVSVTFPEPTFPVEVDNEEINSYLIDHRCFDIVRRA